MEPIGRPLWTEGKRRKVPTPYDEYLKEEKEMAARQLQQQQAQAPQPSEPWTPPDSMRLPLRRGNTTSTLRASAGTVRAVTPEDAVDTDTSQEDASSPLFPERGTTSFERAFIPFTGGPYTGGLAASLGTTTTIVGGPAANTPSSSSSSSHKPRRLVRERNSEREARVGHTSPPGSRNGGGARAPGMHVRSGSRSSRSNGQSHAPPVTATARDAQTTVRPRTRTLEEAWRREREPTIIPSSRNRVGSVHSPSSPVYQGTDYLASVLAATSPPSAPSMTSRGSPVLTPVDTVTRRSISPLSSNTADSLTSSLPTAHARRIVHLMKTLAGRSSGNLVFRRSETSPWSQSHCYVKEDTGSLVYEPKGGEGAHRTLVSDLKGCTVQLNHEGETVIIEVTLPHTGSELHVKLLTQEEFDVWYATFLYWSSQEPLHDRIPSNNTSSHASAVTLSSMPARPAAPPRTSSARTQQRDRAGSSKSDCRKSVVSTLKEAPVIKIGKMIFWDTNVGYSSQSPSAVGQPTAGRPQAYRTQTHGSRRWRRISGQLRENGELKLNSDADNSLISVVQLSQLSRCAIQRLDPSVLENDFCIAIYPQYTSSINNNQPSFVRPIFLSLENRVLFEVWFVLLRAFTIPQLYGPPTHAPYGLAETGADANAAHISTTKDMFRVERSLSLRMVEAKMLPPTASTPAADPAFSGGHVSRHAKPEQHGYYAEVLLDSETRGKTAVKFEGLTPLWGESFDFQDLPPVLSSASVVIKRRPPDSAHAREAYESKLVQEAYGFTSDQHGGFTGLTFDVNCGKVEIYLQELEEEKEVEKWWPVMNMYGHQVGEVLIKARAEEGVILMAHDYQPLSQLLHRFSNALTLQIAAMVPSELKRLSDCLLNIFQVSGKAGDWLMALVEEEIDGITKESPLNRLRYSRRLGSNDSHEAFASHSDRELIVRDLNKSATVEANLLFRGNTLLTKSLDAHMRRVGKEYLEESLGAKIRAINEKDPECEVDPNRVYNPQDLDRNWRRLLLFTQEVWKSIVAAKAKCPVELRVIFRHIRACAEDRYGDFLRSVSYSSVSGFLFLRFFCPAVLNPKLFGLLKEDIKPRARRTYTLIAKSLQTLANMASFGTKEHWMEPMNAFLSQHRESFKTFIDDTCYVPAPPTTSVHSSSTNSSDTYAAGMPSAKTQLSYGTPMTIMQRLPPTSREGFPSLPYLIDQARAFADLVQLWLEVTSPLATADGMGSGNKRHSDIMQAIQHAEGDLHAFHVICTSLNSRTQECLNRAERAERPNSMLSFPWEELLNQLQSNKENGSGDELPSQVSYDEVAKTIASDPSILPPGMQARTTFELPRHREWDPVTDEESDDAQATRLYDPTPPSSTVTPTFDAANTQHVRDAAPRDRPGTASMGSSLHGSLRRALRSRGSDHSATPSASASASNVSSTVSSDTEHLATGTTALPDYEREIRHRERREAAKVLIQRQMEEARVREVERERRKGKTPLAGLKKRREGEGGGGGAGRKGNPALPPRNADMP
ncbi:GTPase activating factor [Friedmanniomyces endolithicus]|nr:GTPase activating factor [Friedmanniomyces endolithicus]KAK0775208.1 GTPase activating factor [Friedmanniomyces endolithicus]KAK0803588.1 GTPase activating factor [Friedmanniomyces endolithicus]KAK0817901.1 GTPase activating factor [Friedmanniomyces endolithicus]KAK0831215.1 GTPase activating factor [Friedmanniomyces endolithicus]